MGKVHNPTKAKTKGRLTPLTPNQTPVSKRGQRRHAKTAEYQANLDERKKQMYGHRVRGTGGVKSLPFKGPSKRPKGTSSNDWASYMSGRSKSL